VFGAVDPGETNPAPVAAAKGVAIDDDGDDAVAREDRVTLEPGAGRRSGRQQHTEADERDVSSHNRQSQSGGPAVAITGSTGLLGSAIAARLEANGYRVRRLVRGTPRGEEIPWDPSQGRLNPAALEGMNAVVHLSGEPVGARWTRDRKVRIRESRVESTRLLSQTIARLSRRPAVMISASAIGVYGDRGDEVLTEASAPSAADGDFLAAVVRDWEAAAEPARSAGVRVVHPRFGIVLSPRGGALKQMLPAFRLGAGARMGGGRQWMSWVSLDDAAGAVEHAIETAELSGPINVTAPEPVTNEEFTRALGTALSRPAALRIPAWALRLALGEMASGTVLVSARVIPEKLLATGYRFLHPSLSGALRDVLGRRGR